MTRFVVAFFALTITYVLTLSSFAAWDLALGAALSAALLVGLRKRVVITDVVTLPALPVRIIAAFPFVVVATKNILAGACRIWPLIILNRPGYPALVSVPLSDATRTGLAIAAWLVALTPGTLLVMVDDKARTILIHALFARDPDAVRRAQQAFYSRYQRKVFP